MNNLKFETNLKIILHHKQFHGFAIILDFIYKLRSVKFKNI